MPRYKITETETIQHLYYVQAKDPSEAIRKAATGVPDQDPETTKHEAHWEVVEAEEE
jgi:hypothetical protein